MNHKRIQIDLSVLDGDMSKMEFNDILQEIYELMDRRMKGVIGDFHVRAE
jgi:hypothetical protein